MEIIIHRASEIPMVTRNPIVRARLRSLLVQAKGNPVAYTPGAGARILWRPKTAKPKQGEPKKKPSKHIFEEGFSGDF